MLPHDDDDTYAYNFDHYYYCDFSAFPRVYLSSLRNKTGYLTPKQISVGGYISLPGQRPLVRNARACPCAANAPPSSPTILRDRANYVDLCSPRLKNSFSPRCRVLLLHLSSFLLLFETFCSKVWWYYLYSVLGEFCSPFECNWRLNESSLSVCGTDNFYPSFRPMSGNWFLKQVLTTYSIFITSRYPFFQLRSNLYKYTSRTPWLPRTRMSTMMPWRPLEMRPLLRLSWKPSRSLRRLRRSLRTTRSCRCVRGGFISPHESIPDRHHVLRCLCFVHHESYYILWLCGENSFILR